jgi:hypothetical protein
MKRLVLLSILSCILLLSLGCRGGSNKKEAYELRERCGKSAAQWVKAKSGEVMNYRVHYNADLNKCFILATLSPVVSNYFYSSFEILYDVDENKEYGHHTTRTYDNGAPENHQCIIKGKFYNNKDQAEVKWKAFVKATMEE